MLSGIVFSPSRVSSSAFFLITEFLCLRKNSFHHGSRSRHIAAVHHFYGVLQWTAQRAETQFLICHKTIFSHIKQAVY